MANHNRVPYRIDFWHGCLHFIIDCNTPFDPKLNPGLLSNIRIRAYSNRKNCQIRPDRFLILQPDLYGILPFFKPGYIASQLQRNALFSHFRMYKSCHIVIQRIHQLVRTLYDGNGDPHFHKIFRHFQSDITAACQNRRFRYVLLDKFTDTQRILYGTQRKQPAAVYSGNIRLYGFCPWRKQQLVIAFFIHPSRFQFMDRNRFPIRIYRRCLMSGPNVDAKPFSKFFGRLQRQRLPAADPAANIVRQTAICIGNVSGTFQNNHLRRFLQTSNTRCSRCSACNTAYDHYFHILFLPHPLLSVLILYTASNTDNA